MKYSIEIGKIVEGALKYDQVKVINYTRQLIEKLHNDNDDRAAGKFSNLLSSHDQGRLSAMDTSRNVPVDSESRSSLVDVIYPNDNTIEVILSESNKEKIQAFITSFRHADKLNALGLGVSNTLMVYGPPGCGKTKCAYLIAKELALPLVVARLDSLISSYLGTTAKNIRNVFEFAQSMPCVLFLDEFDAIAKARDDSNELGELKRVVNSLLQNVDTMSSDSLLLAATNHEHLLDSAVWRRFDYRVEIELPDTEAISKMIDLFSHGIINFDLKDRHLMAIAFRGLSGADVEGIVKKSLRNAFIAGKEVSITDIYNEFFSCSKIIPQNCNDKKEQNIFKASFLRTCDAKLFSYSVIATILGVSKTAVSNLCKEDTP
ncbi:MAG: ATP-binding protein [Sphaerochaeta sp.]|nr:ATP-binding protein [Sphaerochaeta sp.]